MPRRKSTVTIGSGVWRGRVLRYPEGPWVRPSMQRTKHSLFSSLGAWLDNAVFADLFAGGGAVGIEALSRGAARAYFVEHRADALAALRANLAACGAGPARATVHAGTVASVLDARPSPIADATIVFADPEYDVDPNAELLRHFRASDFVQLAWLVVEHRTRVELTPPDGLALVRSRRFGDTVLTYLAPADARGPFEGGWS